MNTILSDVNDTEPNSEILKNNSFMSELEIISA